MSLAVLAALGATAIWLMGFGGMDDVARWAASEQRNAQSGLARGLRAIKAGQPGAWATLMGLCAAYGFFHAAGPGHGKVIIGGYGAATDVPLGRLVGLSLASSLAQAGTAIVLVGAVAQIFALGREQMTGLADNVLAPASYGAIALLGLWLAVRGGRRILRRVPVENHHPDHHHHHDHDHHHHDHHRHDHQHDENCGCGHAHGPSIEEAAAVTSWRDVLAIIATIAIRPCTGAIFLLILCFGLGIPWAGIAGALVMGLGTASVTILVAVAAVMFRGAWQAQWGNGVGMLRAMALLELAAGAFVALVAVSLLMRAL